MNMVIGLLGFACILLALIGTVVGLISPRVFKREGRDVPARKQVLLAGSLAFLASTIVVVVAAVSDKGKTAEQAPVAALPAASAPAAASPPASATPTLAAASPTAQTAAPAADKPAQVSDEDCMKSSECAFERYDLKAQSSCSGAVKRQAEAAAKYQVKFDNSMFSNPLFDKSGFKAGAEKGTHTLIYSGNRALFQNGFGAWQRTRYYCAYNLNAKKVEQVRFDES